ncbi:MAG: glycosyltransferase family 4 protein [Methylococcales bacterium]
MINLLTYTSLYPNSIQTRHGIFIENRVRQLVMTGEVKTRVLSPVPWFPLKSELFGSYQQFAQIPAYENRYGIEISHPRFATIPKIGMSLAPWLMAAATYRVAKSLFINKQFQIIDAHYFYPDGVAAALLGKWLGCPVVISARGTDINLIPDYTLPRRMIIWAAEQAKAIITVCQSLKDRLISLGVANNKITVLPNGVDNQLFHPGDRSMLRKQHQLTQPTLLFVGNLIPLKGVDLIIQSLAKLPDYKLIVVGDGTEKSKLQKLAANLHVSDRVRFVGTLTQQQLVEYYTIADMLLLPSSREGCANVLLEALSCGTPVIATAVGGSPDIVADPSAGLLVQQRTADALTSAIQQLSANMPDSVNVRNYSQRFSWSPIIKQQFDIYQMVINNYLG